MLAAYYDFLGQESFGDLFGGLNIGKRPTAHASQYYVLNLRLSVVPDGRWTLADAFNLLDECINDSCLSFRTRYLEDKNAEKDRKRAAKKRATRGGKKLKAKKRKAWESNDCRHDYSVSVLRAPGVMT